MMITKKAIPRRTLLRGLGATVALPLLDGMVPALTALGTTAAKATPRFGAVYVPNGMVMQNWTPGSHGAAFELTPTLQPLAPFRDQLLVLSGLNSTPPPGTREGGSHSRAATKFLTAVHPGTWDQHEPISMDQIAARALGRHTPLASLELGLEGANFAGSCDSGGFSCAFSYTISWSSGSTPLPMEHNPRAVFERLFGDSETTDPAARRARVREQRSILDSVGDDVARLRGSLGPNDRLKLGAYLDAVRDVERRIEVAEAQGERDVPLMERPLGVPASFAEHATLMYDLQLLAHQTDRTRVTTFMAGHELSGRTYPEIDVPDAHHPISHHRNVPEVLEKLSKINTYHLTLFASFLDKLRSTPDGDGSLLDQMILLYGAGMSDSNAHSPYDLPILLMGGGAGQLKGGRHIEYPGPERTPLANLHVTLLDRLGVGAMFEQHVGDRRMAFGDRPHQRRLVFHGFFGVDVGTAHEDCLHRLGAAGSGAAHQWSLSGCDGGIRVSTRHQQTLHHGRTRVAAGQRQRRDPVVVVRSRMRRHVISRRLQSKLRYGELGRSYGTDAEETNVGGFTPFLFAARQGSVETASLMLSAGANVNDTAPDGASALLVATHSGHGLLATFLLEQGANANAAAAGYTPLHAAVLTGDLHLVEALLGHGARPNAQVTLATRVTRNGQVLMLGEHLLGATPFALAAKFAEVDIMRVLADAGADPVLPLKNGWTPLMLAASASWRYGVWDRRDRAVAKARAFKAEHYDEGGTLAAVTLVVERGADVTAVDEDGNTALHHVVDKGFDRVVEFLIAQGAGLNVTNRREQTPLAIVSRGRTGNTEAAPATAALLRSLGAAEK